jgi:UDP-glucuronate decarboxylase
MENIAHLSRKTNFRLVEHDIAKPIRFDEKIDLVMHLASRASPLEFTRFPIQILKVNTLGIWVSLGIAKEHDAKFLFTSTSEIYGNPAESKVPTSEDYNGNVNPTGLRGCYDEAKRCGEAFVMAYHRQHGLDTRIVRIFNTYGPRLRAGDTYGRVVSRFIDQALKAEPITIFGAGGQTRSFLYITDQVDGLLRAASIPSFSGQVVNIGSQDEIQILKLAEMIKEMTDSSSLITHLPLPEDDPERRCPDLTKAEKLLGWRPQVKLECGLRYTIDWFREKERQEKADRSGLSDHS